MQQDGLFDDASPPSFEETSAKPVEQRYIFLPGLRPDEGYHDITEMDKLEQTARGCFCCPLRRDCTQVVFGDGNPEADIMLVGEGPGETEDQMGKPFVGKAGQLLDKILEAVNFTRSQVYIGNVVKCRPPGNRLPNAQEITACRGYLEAQIRIIRPQIIICLGALATQTVVDPRAKITQVRGRWFSRHEVMIMPTYHPAALLRNENLKRPVWEDFKLIRDEVQKRGLKV
ncbi:MAG: uracil-DNA glycosylase [Chitinophagales bacterium]